MEEVGSDLHLKGCLDGQYCCLTTIHSPFFAYFSETLSHAGHIPQGKQTPS